MDLLGLHHVTAISSNIRENHRFYTQVLGMRLVKRSVNQDDVSAYHLFYADATGTPGTDLTFFDWSIPKEQFGTRSIVRTSLRVEGHAALSWWREHFDELEIPHREIAEIDGRLTLPFQDREGQRLALVDDRGEAPPPAPCCAPGRSGSTTTCTSACGPPGPISKTCTVFNALSGCW